MKRRAKRCKLVDHQTNATKISIEDSIEEHNCGTLTESCHYCGALYWLNELNCARKYTKCCHDGKTLKELNEPPDLLKELILTQSTEAKNYREHIREYNAALALASMGAEINTPPGRGPYCFRIHGQIYHKVSPLYPSEQHKVGYGQLYIFDTGEATIQRLQNNSACLATVMESLDTLLRNINPFAKSYEQMHRLTESLQTAKVQMIFMEQANLDHRRYNAPSSHTEVAAIFVGEDGEPPSNRDICIYPIGETCQIISPMNCNTDPMVYLLLFPHGECGWHIGMAHVEERRSAK
ncbi:uncharacterized protein LOC128343121 [Hemicordylus capensis]|uniref:uncharacterized protein LOC128343121 n=1 Tax=Hemicordylus capensis TaxID=884348 RepID=UPI002303FC03|nr:uncharacterized protein LOC128343121 [Hemicordylus capensis]